MKEKRVRGPDPTGVGPWAMPLGMTGDLIGTRRRRNELHPAAQGVLAAVEGVEWDSLDSRSLDDIERACQHIATLTRIAMATAAGWRHYPDWDRDGPMVERGAYGSWSLDRHDGVVDHPRRMRSAETGELVYVSEPYDLGVEALRRLVALSEQGWDVGIRASVARHFPGHTVAVTFRKRDDS